MTVQTAIIDLCLGCFFKIYQLACKIKFRQHTYYFQPICLKKSHGEILCMPIYMYMSIYSCCQIQPFVFFHLNASVVTMDQAQWRCCVPIVSRWNECMHSGSFVRWKTSGKKIHIQLCEQHCTYSLNQQGQKRKKTILINIYRVMVLREISKPRHDFTGKPLILSFRPPSSTERYKKKKEEKCILF